MPDQYEHLKKERNRLTSLLEEHSDMKGSRTYKQIERELQTVKAGIKKIFREAHHTQKQETTAR